jgi:hypothetical protein
MTKKELAVIEELKIKLALRITENVKPDIPKPESGQTLVKGWSFNSYSKRVEKSCSTCIYHGDGWEKTSSQNAIEQYSTPILAYRAMRREVEKRCARELREIDIKIEGASDEA